MKSYSASVLVLSLTLMLAGPALTRPSGGQESPATMGTVVVSSTPEQYQVYIGPANLSSSVENPAMGFNMPELLIGTSYLRGETPLTLKLEPAEYQLAVATTEITDSLSNRYKRFFASDRVQMISGCTKIQVISGFTKLGKSQENEEIVLIIKERNLIMIAKITKLKVEAGKEISLSIDLMN